MALMAVLSVVVGSVGGALHAYLARRHASAVIAGDIPNRFGVRFGLISLRYGITFLAMALVLQAGLFAPLLVGIGMAIGFVLFNVICVVKKWM